MDVPTPFTPELGGAPGTPAQPSHRSPVRQPETPAQAQERFFAQIRQVLALQQQMLERLETLEARQSEWQTLVTTSLDSMESQLTDLETELGEVTIRLRDVESAVEGLGDLEGKLDSIDSTVQGIESTVNSLESTVSTIEMNMD